MTNVIIKLFRITAYIFLIHLRKQEKSQQNLHSVGLIIFS